MPVIVTSEEVHPFLPSIGSSSAIDKDRALRQDIRPLEILIVNLMADKRSTERQLALWLGSTPLQVNLTFSATDSYVREVQAGRQPKNTPAEHILKFYKPWSELKSEKYDGMIVTGVNALEKRVEQEAIWPEVTAILEWSKKNVFSSLYLCWGAKAALKYFHDIDSHKGSQKLFGLFEHEITSDKTDLLFGFPDRFPVPVSRWKSPRREDILKRPEIEIVADSSESGPNILVESDTLQEGKASYQRRVYLLNHPEYDADTLKNEYVRDRASDPQTPLPRHYFPDDDPEQKPINLWRHAAHLYTNWLKGVYEATPYDRAEIPKAHCVAVRGNQPSVA